MKKRLAVLLGGLLLAVGMPSIALGGNAFTMHPAGSGQKTYASWKANVGEQDSNGTGNQAIFMQKETDKATQAVVVIRGLAGVPLSQLQALSWDQPQFGQPGHHCESSPHWLISLTQPTGVTVVQPFGQCDIGQAHNPSPRNPNWETDTCDTCPSDLRATFGGDATINSLAIVYEDSPGTTNFVLLDHITVASVSGGTHSWDSAADNGGTTALTVGPLVAYADVVSDVLGDLLNLFAAVPVTDWTLYTGIDLTPLPTATTNPVSPPPPPTLP